MKEAEKSLASNAKVKNTLGLGDKSREKIEKVRRLTQAISLIKLF